MSLFVRAAQKDEKVLEVVEMFYFLLLISYHLRIITEELV